MVEGGETSLTAFGISADADLLWHVLLRWPDLDRDALCQRASIDGERVVAALEELRRRGFVESAPSALGLAPVNPAIAVEHAVAVEQRELAARLSQLSNLQAQLPALAQAYSRGRQRIDAELPIEVVDGLEATRSRLILAARSARVEALSVEDEGSTPSGMAAALEIDLEALRRGVHSRTIVQRDCLDEEDVFRYFGTLAAAGEHIRVIDRVPGRMLVFDNEVAVIPLDTADQPRGAIFVRVRTIVDMCVFLFEGMWAEATPLFVAPAADAPSGRAARVLELMATGRKDEAIARSLGVGVRTVRRDIAALMTELGEKTRPATVASAIRRGWLSA